MQGILLQIGHFERGLSKRFKKVNFIFLSNLMSSVWRSHIPVCHAYVTRMCPYFIRMLLVCIRMSLVCTRMSCVFYSYVLVCHLCVTYVIRICFYVVRMYSYVIRMSLVYIRMSLVCTHMLLVCHSYVLVCHPYVTRIWFYHKPEEEEISLISYSLVC